MRTRPSSLVAARAVDLDEGIPVEKTREVIEAAYELVADDLPDDWSVAIVVTSKRGRVYVVTDAPSLDDVAEALERRAEAEAKKARERGKPN